MWSAKKLSKSRWSILISPPQLRIILTTSSSNVSAYSTCSRQRNSCRRRLASFTASVRVCSNSRLIRMRGSLQRQSFYTRRIEETFSLSRVFGQLLFFHAAFQRKFILLGKFMHLIHFGLGNFVGIHARNAKTATVDV